ncbi:ABC transporter ATP-binding protein [Candidatus Micrarchaeota archaeon]|nr:ABC transporter ATP-binding protein [Candidatus Micrarchaeota archaeon]
MDREGAGTVMELRNAWKTYRMGKEKVHALSDFSLKIHKNDYMTIVGPSGSGKSTLLHMLGLLDVPTRGSLLIGGRDISRMGIDERAIIRGRKIGFVFQVFNLVPSLTAIRNVALPMMIQGVPKQVREERAARILSSLGMGHRLDHLPSELSGGQRQRVAMARALVNDPELILADEPTGNLDSKTGEEVVKLFDKLHKDGRTLVVVTHDPSIARHGERTVWIKDGRIERDTTKDTNKPK